MASPVSDRTSIELYARESARVEEMFRGVAPAYDLTNDVLSFGMHRLWKRKLITQAGNVVGKRVLDAATGTGDLALKFARKVGPKGHVVGVDLTQAMLDIASVRSARAGLSSIEWRQADTLALPFEDGSFDVATISFGIRNVKDPVAGLRELGRVLRPGGQLLVLEFGTPDHSSWLTSLTRFYISRVLPRMGSWVSRAGTAYRYLQETADTFPGGKRFLNLMRGAENLVDIKAHAFPGSFVYLYTARIERR